MSPTATDMRAFSRVRVEKVPGDEPYVFAVHTMPDHGTVKEEGMCVCTYAIAPDKPHLCALLTFAESNLNVIFYFSGRLVIARGRARLCNHIATLFSGIRRGTKPVFAGIL